VTAVRGITDVVWSRDSREVERMEGVSVSSTAGSTVICRHSQLSTTDDGREYQCEMVIKVSPPVMADDKHWM